MSIRTLMWTGVVLGLTLETGAAQPRKPVIVDDVYHAITTVRDMYSVGVALEAYHQDNGRYPAADLRTALEPVYVRRLELSDAWGTELKYLVDPQGRDYRLVSAGSDRKFDESTWEHPALLTSSAEDAVFAGHFVRKWAIDIP